LPWRRPSLPELGLRTLVRPSGGCAREAPRQAAPRVVASADPIAVLREVLLVDHEHVAGGNELLAAWSDLGGRNSADDLVRQVGTVELEDEEVGGLRDDEEARGEVGPDIVRVLAVNEPRARRRVEPLSDGTAREHPELHLRPEHVGRKKERERDECESP